MKVSLKLTNASKRYLQKFPSEFKEGFYKGMQESIQLAERDAKRNAPVLTGTLRRSIRSEIEKQTGDYVIGNVFSGLIYSAVIELGWPRRNIAPQPYIEPAIRDNLENFEYRIEKAILREVMRRRS